MSLTQDFKKFLLRGNVVDLAVGVVIGGAFGKIVSAIVDDLVMPAIAPLLPGGNWREATLTPLNFKVGHLLGTTIDFLIVGMVIFLVMVKLIGAMTKRDAAPAPPPTKTCTECLETVTAAARKCKFCTSALAAGLLMLLLATPAAAQSNPSFAFAKPEPVKVVEWNAQVKAAMMFSGGNSRATSGSVGAVASRKAGDNKFGLDLAGAYGESRNRTFEPANGGPSPTLVDSDADVTRTKTESTNNLLGKARYDRFLTEKNSLYAVGALGRDKIAGKKLFGGGQVGYSRLLLKSDAHELSAEAGYDFSYESYYVAGSDPVAVHSARVFVGEAWKVSDATGVYGNVEALFNLNNESKALDAGDAVQPSLGVGPFGDTRINGKLGLTTTLWENLSFGFGLTMKYDANPAPLAATYGPNYRAFADKLDVIADASLIVTLL